MAKLQFKRCPTGIRGFDDIVEGGLPQESITLVTGTPGTAKTLFGLEFIANGAKDFGEKGVFITLEEKAESLCRQFLRFGYDLQELVESNKIKIVEVNIGQDAKNNPFSRLTDKNFIDDLKAFGPKRIVVDSISLVIELSATEGGQRRAVGQLAKTFKELGATTLFMHERKSTSLDSIEYSIEEFISDGIVLLELHRMGNTLQRFMTVVKMRETKHSTGIYSFLIDERGIKIFDLKNL